ncbi:MAG TPA: hypothetical protein VLA04_05655 [Verrucomicrobiae bacterium]|nr:hypothetical protein [Verrucomicrobiae bacterium]
MFNLRIDSYKPTKYQRELVILRSDGDEIIVTNSTLSNSLERAPYGHLAHAVLPHLYRVQARLVDRFDTEYLMIPSSPRQWLLHVMVQARAPSITLEPEELMDVLTSFSEQPHRRSKSKASEYEIHPN